MRAVRLLDHRPVPLTLLGWGYALDTYVFGKEWTITRDDWSLRLRLDSSVRQAPADVTAFDDGYDTGYL